MPYKVSQCLCIESPEQAGMLAFYRDTLGLTVVHEHPDSAELAAGPFRLFLDQRSNQNLIFELLVPDLITARDELVARGCEVLRWEGKGGCCYIRDPFGMLFNLFEEPRAFAATTEQLRNG